MNLLLTLLNIPIAVFQHLGAVKFLMAVAGIFAGLMALRFLDRTIKTLDRADRFFEKRVQRRWRRWSPGTKWAAKLLGGVLAFVVIWPVFPKGIGSFAVLLGLASAWWLQGCRFIQRYDLYDTSPMRAWSHHWDVSRSARRHTNAINNASPKKGGKAHKPVPHATGETFIAEPGDGESAEELAERYNTGQMTSAEAHQNGWAARGVNAIPLPDGKVIVTLDREGPPDEQLDVRWWKL